MLDRDPVPPNPDADDQGFDHQDRVAEVPMRASSSRKKSSRRSSRNGSRGRHASVDPQAGGATSNDQTLGKSPDDLAEAVPCDTADPTHPGSVHSRYQTIAEVGRGGWGVVQRSQDVRLNREVAVKRFVDGDDATKLEKQRFLDEARLTSQLQHPGIIPVHELNQDGEAFYVMKLLEGETLGDSIASFHKSIAAKQLSRFQFGEALEPLLQRFISICNALGYAHEQGIIHRDLKPSNIMVGAFGETIVLDWGLATEVVNGPGEQAVGRDDSDPANQNTASEHCTTGTTEVIGTPSYMSPEQARGELASLQSTTDIYSLGMMLLTIVSEKSPFSGLSVCETLQRVGASDFPAVTEIQPKTPPALAAIIQKAIHPDPMQRYSSAVELGREVRRFVAGDAVSVHQENSLDRALRWCRHHRAIACVSAASLAMLFVGSVFFAMFVVQAHGEERQLRHAAEAEYRNAVASLIESREAIDAWLTELSGTLQFYPGMNHLRDQLLDQAITQYESIASDSYQNTLHPDVIFETVSSKSPAYLSAVECIKAHLRLGDLHRLKGDYVKAQHSYQQGQQVLDHLDGVDGRENRTAVRNVSLQTVNDETISDFDRIVKRGSDLFGPKALLDLERTNLLIAEILIDDSIHDIANRGRASWQSRVEDAGDWITQQAIAASELPATEFTNDAARFINTAVRLELSLTRQQPSTANAPNLSGLKTGVRLSSVLCNKRGTTADRRLREQIQCAYFEQLKRNHQTSTARQAIDQRIADLRAWRDQTPHRLDVRQSLAHALIQRASLQGDGSNTESSVDDYQAGISELESAWKMTDDDAFYRTKLANAQSNLGTLLVGRKASRDAAWHLLVKALASYQELLRDTATPARLRRFALTHHSLMKCFDESSDQQLEHAAACASAFNIMQGYQELENADLRIWIDTEQLLATQYRLRNRKTEAATSLQMVKQLLGKLDQANDDAKGLGLNIAPTF